MADIDPEPEQMQHPLKDQGKELIEVNLTEEGRKAQPLFFSASLAFVLKTTLLELLRNMMDVFLAYAELPGLNDYSHINLIKEGTRPIKQSLRNFRLELEVYIKQKIQKLLDVSLSSLSNTF